MNELEKIALNRMEREIAAGNIQRSDVVPGAFNSKSGFGAVAGKGFARRTLATPAPVAPEQLARNRAISAGSFKAGLSQPGVTAEALPGMVAANVNGHSYVPPNVSQYMDSMVNKPLGGLRAVASSLAPKQLAGPLLPNPTAAASTINNGILQHEHAERQLFKRKGTVTPVASHFGARPIMAEQMAARGDPEALSFFSKMRKMHPDDALVMKKIREAGGLPGRPLPLGGRAERAVDRGIGRNVKNLTTATRQNATKMEMLGKPVSYMPKDLSAHLGTIRPGVEKMMELGGKTNRGNLMSQLPKFVEPLKQFGRTMLRTGKFVRSGV
jgi:hypothetical protein